MTDTAAHRDVVEQVATQSFDPLLVLEPLTAFLDAAGVGSGPVSAEPIGAGHSNLTYLLRRGRERFCLRRPPRGPLPRSTHDVLREARLQLALSGHGVRTPEVITACEDQRVIGAPFYVMAFLDGHVLSDKLPGTLDAPGAGERIAEQLIDSLIELHAVDPTADDLAGFGRPVGYLDRQIDRFRGLLAASANRSLPALESTADWLAAHRPARSETSVVHGDYRLGNVMFADGWPPQVSAVLDWEMATLGDPLADLGYLTAMWSSLDDPTDPMLELSRLTRSPGFPDREWLTAEYARRSGRDTSELVWYQTLAIWKAAIFLEGSYGRYLAGTTDDAYFRSLEAGVPLLAERAARLIHS
jgi:aminoglycoside phosphotransferase (APT) family kinase protein